MNFLRRPPKERLEGERGMKGCSGRQEIKDNLRQENIAA